MVIRAWLPRLMLIACVCAFIDLFDCSALAAIFYGVLRVALFHPLLRPGYAKWLKGTPWNASKRLFLGPLTLTVADGAVLIVLMVLTPKNQNSLFAPMLFALSYLLVHTFCFWRLKLVGPFYSILFLMGLFFLVPFVSFRLLLMCAMLVAAYSGISKALESFPWPEQAYFRPGENSRVSRTIENLRGWPFEVLSPKPPSVLSPIAFPAFANHLLVAWWIFVLLSLISDGLPRRESHETSVEVLAFYSLILSMSLWIKFRKWHRAPISWSGRIASGRFIIPAYDRIFVAPLFILIAGCLGAPLFIEALPFVPPFIVAVMVVFFGAVACFFATPFDEFHFTGDHRLDPNSAYKFLEGNDNRRIRASMR